jgi:hypothetical protein
MLGGPPVLTPKKQGRYQCGNRDTESLKSGVNERMPQPCKVCRHRELDQLTEDCAQGYSLRWLARKYG